MMNDLEVLREMFKDGRDHIGIGTVIQLGIAKDRSKLRVMINLMPENRHVVAEMTFSDVMDVTFPEINDLAVVAFVDGNPDQCYVLKLINNKEEKIPKFAKDGHKVAYSRPDKKYYLGSDTKICLSLPDHEPTEPLVLGNQLMDFMSSVIEQVLSVFSAIADGPVSDFGNLGAPVPTSIEITAAITAATNQLNNLKSKYISNDSTNVVSQIAFTERGES